MDILCTGRPVTEIVTHDAPQHAIGRNIALLGSRAFAIATH